MSLPEMVTPHGELVRLVTAAHLLAAAGLDPDALPEAEATALAVFTDNADHLIAIAREAKALAGSEFVRRMDRRGSWTLRFDGWVATSASPTAGTVKYDDEQLAAVLDRLVEADLIDREAATAAIEWVKPPPPAPHWKQKPAGVKALLKLGDEVVAAIESCRVPVEPPERTARVKFEGDKS